MASLSNYAANQLCTFYLRSTAPTRPSPIYVALLTTNCIATDLHLDGSGVGVEASFGSYARVSITPSDSNFGSPSGGISSNSGTITFPMSTSGSQVITGAALLDGSGSSANILMFAALNASKTLTSGDTFSFPISNFTVTFS